MRKLKLCMEISISNAEKDALLCMFFHGVFEKLCDEKTLCMLVIIIID